jgi:dihydrofolate reductase
MRKVIVNEWMSLDGVVQALRRRRRGHHRWLQARRLHLRYFDDISRKWVVDNLAGAGGLVLWRRTYDGFAAYWPNATWSTSFS